MTMSRTRMVWLAVPLVLAVIATSWAVAQRYRYRYRPEMGIPPDRAGIPDWENKDLFRDDVFTFVRIQYDSGRGYGRGYWGGGGRWGIDWPDSDLNFSYRLQQLTSLKVNPDPIFMRLTDERLFDYPFIYIIEPGWLHFSEPEVEALRRYLDNGGFLMVDDFWGDSQWRNFAREIKRVFPEQDPVDLPLDHPIFHTVYDLKEKPQIPSIGEAIQGRPYGITWESRHDGNTRDVHYRGLFDDRGRLVVLICHNTDLGDGWEREGENEWYFHEFSEKRAYPMGINIITYVMTH